MKIIKWIKKKQSSLPFKIKIFLMSFVFMFVFFLLFYRILFEVMMSGFKEQQQEEIISKAEMLSALPSINELQVNEWLEKLVIEGERIRFVDSSGQIKYETSSEYKVDFPDTLYVTEPSFHREKENEYMIYTYRFPFTANHFSGSIEVSRNMKLLINQMIKPMHPLLLWGGVAAAMLSGLVSFFLSRQLLLPMREMIHTMKRIRQKSLKERMPLYNRNDEIGHLSEMFNEMMNELEGSFNQQKQFIEDASHELRTPVTILEGHLNLLNRWGKDNPEILEESLRTSTHELNRMKQLVLTLLELTRSEVEEKTLPKEIINPYQKLIQLIEDFKPVYPEVLFSIREGEKDVAILIDGDRFEQIFRILVDNALKYSKSEEVSLGVTKNFEQISITVEDKGIGIADEHLPYLFNRFYRVDKSRSREQGGTGLGLSIAKNLVEKYEGTIEIESKKGEGTSVIVSFPAIYIS
ncbi:sensor histidine kinase [Chengkuizengella sediminis]|uniref:sensor histidine kinase n=1 Tax=Chengkuizengella sediminis TaxID=1885917 RepID=UPI00138A64CE|nr:HAMP domain-containing sensor histidine kinase [Chengkuizengella sediminis]NDI36902.1 HAMP domain-containing histidine kinase [Chengkuizengella sediminis]